MYARMAQGDAMAATEIPAASVCQKALPGKMRVFL
jgi:hypothetical protein